MSQLAIDLLELVRLRGTSHGALIERLLKAVALNLIAPGVADVHAGC